MCNNLEIKLFRFKRKTDYLSYYSTHLVDCSSNDTVLDLFIKISKDSDIGFIDSSKFALIVNGKFILADTKIKILIETFGKSLIFDPISKSRSIDDFIIDLNGFNEGKKLLKEYFESDDICCYDDYLLKHYASYLEDFDCDFIGNGVLFFIADNIEKLSLQKRYDILKSISETDGIWSYLSLKNRLFDYKDEDRKISNLKAEILRFKPDFNEFISSEREYLSQCLKMSQKAIGENL